MGCCICQWTVPSINNCCILMTTNLTISRGWRTGVATLERICRVLVIIQNILTRCAPDMWHWSVHMVFCYVSMQSLLSCFLHLNFSIEFSAKKSELLWLSYWKFGGKDPAFDNGDGFSVSRWSSCTNKEGWCANVAWRGRNWW